MYLSICLSMDLVDQIRNCPELGWTRLTVDLEGLSRLGFNPFPIDVGCILLEKGWVIQLAGRISNHRKQRPQVAFKAERTGGML